MPKCLKVLAYVLIIVGALNWGLVGAFNFDLVKQIFGDMTMLSRAVYILVGLSAIISISTGGCPCGCHEEEGCDCGVEGCECDSRESCECDTTKENMQDDA